MKLSPNTNPPEPADLLIRFHNQTGAAVDVTGRPRTYACRWCCHGCGERASSGDYLKSTRPKANEHAATCRASYHRLG
ncbi:hypothetical protein ABZ621_23490 [Streptomyces sp. NPDC007863]|uniref:hypothetical protein n=1 Tax=Streptomyces sp. NPDC007863 TaxID=3154894 RepID=UPI00340F2B01